MIDHPAPALEWLDAFSACVRARDFARGRALFTPEVRGFGSITSMMVGLDALEREQWRRVWPTIEDFAFARDTLAVYGQPADGTLTLASGWTSTGARADRTTYPRPGRATLVLQLRGERWLCVHSHFSLSPAAP